MSEIFTGVANWLTLLRIPCLFFVLYGLLFLGEPTGFYIAVGAFTIACVLDKLDGVWARKMSKPTALGQFLDQLVDKIFLWPVWWTITWLHADQVPLIWYHCSIGLMILDLQSASLHTQAYWESRGLGVFNPKAGAVISGKLKFFLQMFTVGCFLGSRWPQENGVWLGTITSEVRELGKFFAFISLVFVVAALALAINSLRQRAAAKTESLVQL